MTNRAVDIGAIMMDEQNPASLLLEAEVHPAQPSQRARDGVMALGRREKSHEAARSRSEQFAAYGPRLAGQAIPLVNIPGADARSEALLENPALVQDFPAGVRAILLQLDAQLVRHVNQLLHHFLFFSLRLHSVALALQDSRGAARDPGVKSDQVGLQMLDGL